jgi:hypothetical protein
MYSHAMMRANGAKVGTTTMITPKDARKFKTPDNAARAEFCSALSTVLISEVNLLRILPIGVTSKNRVGALDSLLSNETNSERDAWRLA